MSIYEGWNENALEAYLSESEPVHKCAWCEANLLSFDYYYEINGEKLCENCAEDFLKDLRRDTDYLEEVGLF